jgi:hypothetical protein
MLSSANVRYLECWIALQKSMLNIHIYIYIYIYIHKSKRPKTDPCGTRKKIEE